MTPNISYKFEKQLKRDGVFSQKTKIIKRIPFIPPPHPLKPKQKNEQKKISLFERKVKKKKEPSALFVCPAPEKGRKLQEGDQLRENQKNMTTLY